MVRGKKTPDPLEQLGKDLAADHTTAKNIADTVAAGAIEGAGAVMDAGGDANQTAAGAIGGAAAATAEALEVESGSVKINGDVKVDGVVAGAIPANEDPPESDEADENGVDEAYQRRMDRLVRIVEEAEFESGTAVGDIRDVLRELFKARDKAYHLLDANERRTLDDQLTKVAQLVVRRVVLIIAEEESVTLQGTMLDALSVKGETLEVKLKVEHVDKDVLMDAYNLAGQRVVVVSASDKRFLGARRPNDPGERQVEIPFADAQFAEDKPPAAPSDDKDLAGEDGTAESSEDLDAEASDPDAADWIVYDAEGEVWLAAASEDDPWTDDAEKAMRFTLQEAKDECESHGEGMVVQRSPLAVTPPAEPAQAETEQGDEG